MELEWTSTLAECFAPSKSEIYNYAPCVVQTDDSTRYAFYCTNMESGIIVDYIGWRKGVKESDGQWRWGEEGIALSPGETGWDSIHVCDPDLLQGEFRYKGHTYSWALFYLGCDRLDCNHNQIGVAFADSIEGPWIKCDDNPVVSGALEYWGTGQCTQVTIDGKGKFDLIYRDADETGDNYKLASCDFSDMDAYVVGTPVRLSKAGLPDVPLCMSHVAYDSVNDTMLLVAEKGWDGVVRCCQEIVVAAISGTSFRKGEGTWEVLAIIDESLTGSYGNHNAALCRDPFGRVPERDELGIFISSATKTYIWSFRICELRARLLRQ
ncbi:hypothetical protein [Paenibacillus sp. CF384]|uniref:hypothetical protein n=1 Tax=Paenibacillus sp. CF384 TaxID=1884382 RepID=UPI000895DA5A|nr:hypothetical protein [Paenibacillus sp. CF384]SDW90694.1 hypothetical protein SAMN05518855_1006244 [Paenibacillus sp. CF384]